MAKTVMMGALDALVGVVFSGTGLTQGTVTAIDGSVTTSSASAQQVVSYGGMTQTVGTQLIPLAGITYQVSAVDDFANMLTVDAYLGTTLVGEIDFSVVGISAAGVALCGIPLASMIEQSGNLAALSDAIFMLGANSAGAAGESIDFTVAASYNFIPGANAAYATAASPVLTGTSGPQMLIGLSGNDTITAGSGGTVIAAGPGNDTIYGGSGPDAIYGGAGTSTIHAGTGRDALFGGTGTDIYVFAPGHTGGLTPASADSIQRFHPGHGDRIDLSAFDALLPAGGHLSFIGTAAFDGTPGEVRYSVSGTSLVITGDLTGSGTPAFEIVVTRFPKLVAHEFIL